MTTRNLMFLELLKTFDICSCTGPAQDTLLVAGSRKGLQLAATRQLRNAKLKRRRIGTWRGFLSFCKMDRVR